MNITTIDHADELERFVSESKQIYGVLIDAHFGLTLAAAAKELRRLRGAVSAFEKPRGDDRCYLDDQKLLHDAFGTTPDPYTTALAPEADHIESCRRYWRQRQCPEVAGKFRLPDDMTIAEMTEEVARLRADLAEVLGMWRSAVDLCYRCDGTGRVTEGECPRCGKMRAFVAQRSQAIGIDPEKVDPEDRVR